MTDRYHSLIVVLETDMRTDDAEPLINAIKRLRGVLDVAGQISGSLETHLAETRARRELGEKLWNVLYPTRPDKDG